MKRINHRKILIFIGGITGIILMIYLILYFYLQRADCDQWMYKFDEYITKSLLPIIENPDSLCHNFKISNPKRAIAKLIIENREFVFKGISKTWNIWMLSNNRNIDSDKEGHYYKIDMNTLCKTFLSMANNRYPSIINWKWKNPQELTCK